MTFRTYIERFLRQLYGEQPSDDASVTVNLVATWLPDALATAAKQCYVEQAKLEGVAALNSGFYTTFKGLTLTKDDPGLWLVSLPAIPVGLGQVDSISRAVLRDAAGNISRPLILVSSMQRPYVQGHRQLPEQTLCYQEGKSLFICSPLNLTAFTAQVTLVSGGDPTSLDSEMIVPPDYLPVISEYLKAQLGSEQARPRDNVADGRDNNAQTP